MGAYHFQTKQVDHDPFADGAKGSGIRESMRDYLPEFLGGWPAGKSVSGDQNRGYPTDEDAEFAAKNENAYATSFEPYVKNEIGRVLGAIQKGKFTAIKGAGYSTKEMTSDELKALVPVRSTDVMDEETRANLRNHFAKAALASARDPIASLGFSPKDVLFDTAIDPETATIGGVTSEETQNIYANRADQGAGIVHESIHRGLMKLAERNPEGVFDAFDKYNRATDHRKSSVQTYDKMHEPIARYIMKTVMGDPETGSVSRSQKEAATYLFEKAWDSQHFKTLLSDLQGLAAAEIAKKRPGGPR